MYRVGPILSNLSPLGTVRATLTAHGSSPQLLLCLRDCLTFLLFIFFVFFFILASRHKTLRNYLCATDKNKSIEVCREFVIRT